MAAGSSARMRGVDKLWADIAGKPLLVRTLDVFQRSPQISGIVVVAADDRIRRVRETASSEGFTKVCGVVAGGSTRQASVLAGLRALAPVDLVAVHDAARPLVGAELIERGVELALARGSALCAVPAKSTLKLVCDDGSVESTPPRERIWEAQTPQVFRYDDLLAAHTAAQDQSHTDDAALMEAAGYRVWVYEGSYRNIKVTTPEDLIVARALFGGGS